ncbi:60S ribosomal export protein NMD3 [Methanofollis fontis]|uniref:NMD protein affecting ribosome stability and mRNA decay n=1 Tax=Methanofollis fontis TaxID=2052832 RepID=A0A483CPG0_9EURY|nr:60S ribosomal export protein NMD3 [Methanofollis fontis]TAJ44575.1 NMD protein affecting ribosome stability and mRNA decay [Methanofollis fontis]
MDILTSVCPRCGRPSVGLCRECRAGETEWLTCEPRLESIYCPVCGSQKRGKTWSDTTVDRETLLQEIAASAVHLHPDLRGPEITFTFRDTSPNRTIASASVSGKLYGVPVSGECRTLIIWRKEQCDRCNRISGGYYEGIIQVRATGRRPSLYETETAARIAEESESALQDAGERLSFVSQIEEKKDGLDIVVGSNHIGQVISGAIAGALGGRVTTHPKLVGEKDGKRLYRITFLVRLPRYQRGDVVVVRDRYLEVRSTSQGQIHGFDLQEGSGRIIKEDEIERQVGNVGEAEDALVAYLYDDIIGLLDPKTQEAVECRAYGWLRPEEGGMIRVVRDTETGRFVLVG